MTVGSALHGVFVRSPQNSSNHTQRETRALRSPALVFVFEGLLVGVDSKRSGPEVSPWPLDGPRDTAIGLEIGGQGGPEGFELEGGAADGDEGADRVVRLFFVQGDAEAVSIRG